jgi:multicomponent Na+:H+ antiporter subunit D
VSALLSALVIKASFYLILRLWFDVFAPIDFSVTAAQLVGALGAGAVLWGSLLALRQTQLKMLVAYSTVAQVGYLFLLLPLATGTTADDRRAHWQGGVLQVVTHGLAKAAMFAAAGAMITYHRAQ